MNAQWFFARPSGRIRNLALALAALLAARSTAAEPTQATIDAAKAVIAGTGAHKGNDKLVLSFCYPTAKSATAVEYVAGTTSKDGSFDLTFRYAYRDGNNDPADFQLRYAFDRNGKIVSVRAVDGKHSSPRAPLKDAQGTLELMKEAARNDATLKNDPAWKALLALDSPADFMTGVMNLKAGK